MRTCSGSAARGRRRAAPPWPAQAERGDGRQALGARGPVDAPRLVTLAPELAQARHGHEALGDARGQADPGEGAARRRSRGTAGTTRGGTWRWSGRAPPAATTWRRTAAACATAAAPAPRRCGRPPRRPSGRPRSSARSGARRAARRAAHSSATMNSMTPLGALRSRRIRSSEMPSVPHGTKDSSAIILPSASNASTSRQSPSSGSPSRSSAIEKPRSVSVSRQASARSMTSSISSSERAEWRRTRKVAPVRRTRLTACRVTRISRPSRSKSGDVQDRLVAELQRAEPGARVRVGAVLARAHHGGLPGVPPGHVQPGLDGVRPGLAVAHGVAAGQADAGLDAVGDGGLAAGREDDGLVAPGGEVAERVLRAVRARAAPGSGAPRRRAGPLPCAGSGRAWRRRSAGRGRRTGRARSTGRAAGAPSK